MQKQNLEKVRLPILMLLMLLPLWSAADWRWQGVERVVAISDVHGAHEAMVQTLRNAEVLDANAGWSGGATHLVITGDILDRGPASRQVMDLLMRLEGEAVQSGGRVHLLLGNHEVMNLVGDLRYVSAAEYEAFAAEEEADEREQAFERFYAARRAAAEDREEPDEAALRREFESRAPAGYFAHRRAFAPEGRYGKWLLGKPLVVVINDTAFVHGGLSPMVTQLGLEGVNRSLVSQVADYAADLDVLVQAGIIDATENFYRHAAALSGLPVTGQHAAEIDEAIVGVIRLNNASVHDSSSPVWYRGNVGCGSLIESDKLDAALRSIGAARVVVGHTPTPGRQVLHRLDGRVIEIDTGMLTASYGGSGHALVIEGDTHYVVSESGREALSPAPHPRQVERQAAGLSVAQLERILAGGEAAAAGRDDHGREVVEIRDAGTSLSAQFLKSPPGKKVAPEVAAYRLDRMLNLDMVPVTVEREFGGAQGALQLLPGTEKSESIRAPSGEGASAWCPLPEQWQAMYLFDALSFNVGRSPDSMLYAPGNWQLILVNHGGAFAARNGPPGWLRKAGISPGKAWAEALTALSDDLLEDALGDVLDGRRLAALGKRRDDLLREAAE